MVKRAAEMIEEDYVRQTESILDGWKQSTRSSSAHTSRLERAVLVTALLDHHSTSKVESAVSRFSRTSTALAIAMIVLAVAHFVIALLAWSK